MAKKDLSKLSNEELEQLSFELSEQRAKADADIRAEQLEVQDEISKRARRRRLESLTAEERAELAAMAEEDSKNG